MLGRAKRIRIEKETTTIIDGSGEKSDIEARVGQIKADLVKEEVETRKRSIADVVLWQGNPQSIPWRWLRTTSSKPMVGDHGMTLFDVLRRRYETSSRSGIRYKGVTQKALHSWLR